MNISFRSDEDFAHELDARDPLYDHRELFHVPTRADGTPLIYLASHSLGLQPKALAALMREELDHWALHGVEGHFHDPRPWYTYQELLRGPAARLVGALPHEVVHMNGLTINLHLMMVSFYRPTPERHKIVIESPPFPSDLYAVKSQLRYHGHEPADSLLFIEPRRGEHAIRTEDYETLLDTRGPEIALVLINAVNFLTGQWLDVPRLITAARRQGCVVGLDLAHAAGNVPLALHEWGPDFAVWCTYKYLCGGPGAVGGCFVHERHSGKLDLPRFAGWWGNDPATRFRMQLEPEFIPHAGADGWQVSNPPILALVPLRAALAIFDETGMAGLRGKSELLGSYLFYLLDQLPPHRLEILTPRDASQRGCQISIAMQRSRETFEALTALGIVADFRQPNVIRVAPAPLYNTFHDVWAFVQTLRQPV
jgi:kynureninase